MSTDTRPSEVFRCSFCEKSQDEVARLISGPAADLFICGGCIRLCKEILDEGDDMTVDTRPSVTVVGTIVADELGLQHIDTDGLIPLADIGLQDGDEVEVTIKKHERATGSLFPASDEAGE